jgi:hypothetical protein
MNFRLICNIFVGNLTYSPIFPAKVAKTSLDRYLDYQRCCSRCLPPRARELSSGDLEFDRFTEE